MIHCNLTLCVYCSYEFSHSFKNTISTVQFLSTVAERPVSMTSEAEVLLKKYFVANVGRHFLASLFDGASFSRRGVALECLEKLFKIFGPVPSLMSSEANAEILFRCLDDSFDKNCLLAIDILSYFPASVTKLDDPAFIQALWSVLLLLFTP